MVFALLGGLAAWTAEPLAPSFALKSVVVYRIEVALAVFAAGYAFVVALWLAYRGHTVRRLELPGGAAVEAPDMAALDRAADDFEVFETRTVERLDTLDQAIAEIDSRLAAVESRSPG